MYKAEIHCHIEGAAQPALTKRLAKKYGVDTGDIIKNDKYIWSDFSDFLECYEKVAKIFRNPEDYQLLTYDVLTRLAEQDTIYSELMLPPQIANGIPYSELVEAVEGGIEDAKRETGIETRIIITAVRHYGADVAEQLAELVAENPHPMVTGFGMAGDENFGEVEEFTTAFDIARDAGLGLTVHAGEHRGPQSIQDAINLLDVKRIGHGVRAIEDTNLIKELVRKKITLEVCQSSNVALKLYPSHDEHPLKILINAGVRVCLNSDDPPYFDTDIKNEYEVSGLNEEQLKQCTLNAINAAFVDQQTKQNLIQKVQQKKGNSI